MGKGEGLRPCVPIGERKSQRNSGSLKNRTDCIQEVREILWGPLMEGFKRQVEELRLYEWETNKVWTLEPWRSWRMPRDGDLSERSEQQLQMGKEGTKGTRATHPEESWPLLEEGLVREVTDQSSGDLREASFCGWD